MKLSSPDFENSATIPREYGYKNENVNPPLQIDGVPENAQSLVLIVDDPDALEPAGKIWDHWVVWNINPSTKEIPRDWNVAEAGAEEGQNDYGESGYGGPNPPDREHTYKFKLYALDTELNLSADATKDDVENGMDGHILESTTFEGRYAP